LLEERLPPQNIEAEQSVLGSMIIERDAIFSTTEILRDDDFYRSSHQKIFSAMISLVERNEPVDLVTLSEELGNRGVLEETGGNAYLTSLANAVPTAANVKYYAQIVWEKALLRRLIRISTEIVTRSYEPPEDVVEFLDEAEQMIFQVARELSGKGFVPLKDVLMETFERIEQLYEEKKGVTGLSTGFLDLDQILSGLQRSDLVIVAARPAMGKTTLALNMAQHIAVSEKNPVAFYSMEMSQDQLAQRLLCAQANLDSQRMRRGFLTQEEWPRLTRAVGPLSEAPLYIDDTAGLSVMEMRAKARRLKAEKSLSAIFVDYLQLMRSHGNQENRQQELSDISRSLKALAKELDVPVVALSQLSRAVEKRNDRRPILSDLMESGGIEANADVVMFIYREDYYFSESEKKNIAEVIVAKQRNGPTGQIDLLFMDNYNKFQNLAPQQYSEEAGGA